MSSLVYLVDDDERVRLALTQSLLQHGFQVRAFASGSEFFHDFDPGARGCVLLDLRMPDMSGLAVQDQLLEHGIDLPIIFMSAYGTVRESVQAMKTGAVDFLVKPFGVTELVVLIRTVLQRDAEARDRHKAHERARELFTQLTDREKQVSMRVALGQTSKEIAAALGISPRTVDHHRTRILLKLEVDSIAELAALVAAEFGDEFGGPA